MVLYNSNDSSSCHRVRIALHWKEILFDTVELSLHRMGGLTGIRGFEEFSPTSQVPVLCDGRFFLSQTEAILEFLEEKYPSNPLLPRDFETRARVREFCQLIACDIHPLGTLRVRKYLSMQMAQSQEARDRWHSHWITEGFEILEKRVSCEGRYCFADSVSMADLFLIPKLVKARSAGVALSNYPRLLEIEENCSSLSAFMRGHPGDSSELGATSLSNL